MKKISAIVITLILAATLFTGCSLTGSDWFYYGSDSDSDETESASTSTAKSYTDDSDETEETDDPTSTPTGETPEFKYNDSDTTYTVAEIYANNVNSVVGITTSETTTNVWGQISQSASSGTGIVLSSDGYILTNHHVIEDGESYQVTFYDGTSYSATLVGSEESNDVAVLKIDATGLSAASFGDSDEIIVGEDVVVIGNPLGELTYTLTRGVVSALNRVINTSDTPIKMFQVDAAINAGNSGGPAFDACGNVIGMVTAKYASSDIEGLGFCIPINDALKVASELIEFGYVKGKAALGIGATEAYSRSRWGMSQRVSGAYINYVVSGSCADNAGLCEGMLINYIDTTSITSSSDLATALKSYSAGDTATIKGYYNDEYFEKTVTLDEYTPSLIPSNWDSNDGTIM